MLQAIIDIGSNTVRLCIYRECAGRWELVLKRKERLGLAAHVIDGAMSASGVHECAKVLKGFAALLGQLRIAKVRAFATAALRNAVNSAEAVAALERESGVSIRVLSGAEEAALGFAGAVHDLGDGSGLLVDIGGGSTEITLYERKSVVRQVSVPLGSLALRTGRVAGLLPTVPEIAAMRATVVAELDTVPWGGATPSAGWDGRGAAAPLHYQPRPEPPQRIFCGLGGTFKSALALYREYYGPESPDPNVMEAERLFALARRYLLRDDGSLPGEEDLVRLMCAAPDRMHTLLPGLVIAEELVRRLHAPTIVYSDSGVREGFLYSA